MSNHHYNVGVSNSDHAATVDSNSTAATKYTVLSNVSARPNIESAARSGKRRRGSGRNWKDATSETQKGTGGTFIILRILHLELSGKEVIFIRLT